jgi:hypothetical protein
VRAEGLELAPNARFEPLPVEWLRQRDHVHRVVRMHFTPSHHRHLKQVEPAFLDTPGLSAARALMPLRLDAPMLLTLYQMSAAARCWRCRCPVLGQRGLCRRGIVIVDPGASRRIARQIACARHPDMAGRSGQLDVTHLRAPVGVVCLAARRRTGDHVPLDREPGEFLDRVGDRAELPHHRPLSEQKTGELAGGERGDIRNLESNHWTLESGQRIDDGRALLAGRSAVRGIVERVELELSACLLLCRSYGIIVIEYSQSAGTIASKVSRVLPSRGSRASPDINREYNGSRDQRIP